MAVVATHARLGYLPEITDHFDAFGWEMAKTAFMKAGFA